MRMEGELGDHHSGELHLASAETKAERIVAEELKRQGWQEEDLVTRRKNDPLELELALGCGGKRRLRSRRLRRGCIWEVPGRRMPNCTNRCGGVKGRAAAKSASASNGMKPNEKLKNEPNYGLTPLIAPNTEVISIWMARMPRSNRTAALWHQPRGRPESTSPASGAG